MTSTPAALAPGRRKGPNPAVVAERSRRLRRRGSGRLSARVKPGLLAGARIPR